MRTIPQCYYHESILSFIADKIDYDGITSFDSLIDTDQEALTVLCMNRLGKDAYDVLIQGDSTDIVIANLSKFMTTYDMDEGHELLNSLRKNAVQAVSSQMTFLFNEIYSERKSA